MGSMFLSTKDYFDSIGHFPVSMDGLIFFGLTLLVLYIIMR